MEIINEAESYASLMPATERAKELGLIVSYPEDNEIQIDIDSEEALKEFQELWEITHTMFYLSAPTIIPSKTPGHFHVTCTTINKLTDIERLCLQSILGDDKKRCIFNYFRYQELGISDSCFFEKGEEKC